MEIVATTLLPAVDRPNADRWNALSLCQKSRGYWLELAEENKKSKDESTVITAQNQVHCNLAIRLSSTLIHTDGRILENSIPSNPVRITKSSNKNNESEITLGANIRIWDRGIKSWR